MAYSGQAIRARALDFARAPRTRKIAIWLVAIVVAIGVLGALVAPYVLRRVLAQQLTTKLHRPVTIEQIRINPYAMTVAIRGVAVKERDGTATAVSFDELYANVQLASLFRVAPVLKEVRLARPYINLIRQQDFKYNFQDLIDEFTSGPPTGGPPPRFAISNVQIIDGKVDFDDRPEGTKHSITAIRLGVPFISSLPNDSDIFVKPAFSALVNGTPVELNGDTKPFKDSHESTLDINIDDLQVPKYLGYSPIKLNFTVPSGKIDGKLKISFKTTKGQEAALNVAGDVGLRDLAIKESSDTPLVNLPVLDISIGSLQIFARRADLKSVSGQRLEVYLKRRRDGGINFASLTETPAHDGAATQSPSDGTRKADAPFVFRIEQLSLDSAQLHYADETTSTPYQTRLDNVRLDIKGLSNEPEKKAAVEIAFESEAKERFAHSGAVQLAPLSAEGKLEIEGLRPGGFRPFFQDALALEVREGSVDLSTRYRFQQLDTGSDLRLSELQAAVRDLRLEEGNKKPLGRIPLLTVKDTAIDIGQKTISIGALEGRDASGIVQRNSDGTLNFQRLVKPTQTSSPSIQGSAKKDEPAWKIETKLIALNRFKVDFEDHAASSPAKVSISDITMRAENLSSAKKQRGRASLQAKINNGQVRLTGPIGLDPLAASLQLEGRDIDVTPFQPYLENQVNFVVTGGRVGAKGSLIFDTSTPGPAQVTYKGDLSLADFASVDKEGSQDLLKWGSLSLGGVQYAANPMGVRVDAIDLSDFYARIIIAADGTVNLQKLRVENESQQVPDGENKEASPPDNAPANDQRISIGQINLRQGNINFSDLFVKPNYSANLDSVQGTVGELKPDAAADLVLDAKLDGYAPVDIRGKINPLGKDLFMDIKAKASGIDLNPFTPYSTKYIGYGIEKGQLTFDVAYKLEGRKLEAQTQFVLDQLTFGEKVESPTAINLPVTLAVALLKDRNGVINVGLPISGSLDDPQFSVGGIVWRLIVNIITKAVTAPFALLGSVFGGGGGAELSYIEFDYGRATLTQAAEAKIKTLTTAMLDRPALKLEITGRSDPVNDLEGLKRVGIENKVRAQKLKELARQGPAPKSVDEVQVPKDEYERFLRAAYDAETFPKPRNVVGLAKSLPVPEMEDLMFKHATVSDDDLRALANRRAQAVRDRLLEAKVSADRLFIVAPKPFTKEEQEKLKGRASRVDFSLR